MRKIVYSILISFGFISGIYADFDSKHTVHFASESDAKESSPDKAQEGQLSVPEAENSSIDTIVESVIGFGSGIVGASASKILGALMSQVAEIDGGFPIRIASLVLPMALTIAIGSEIKKIPFFAKKHVMAATALGSFCSSLIPIHNYIN